MIKIKRLLVGLMVGIVLLGQVGCETGQKPLHQHDAGQRGAIATVHPLATRAGMDAFKKGGNAIDAAVAAALTLGVVDGFNSGIGGGCFILIHTADGELIAIDGREMASAKAHRDMYIVDGKLDGRLSKTGPLASGVPGSLMGYDHILKEYGRHTLGELLLPAAEIAERGFTIDANYVSRLKRVTEDLRRYPASAKIFLNDQGEAYGVGHFLRQRDLAQTYRNIAEEGIEWFYNGPFAFGVELYMRGNGGILSAEDFGNYEIKKRKAIVTQFRDLEVVGFPPPSSGGIHVGQILNVYEAAGERYPEVMKTEAGRLHLLAQSMQAAFADRAYFLGDADYVKVPREGLISEGYAGELVNGIDPAKHVVREKYGNPGAFGGNGGGNGVGSGGGKHTTHIAAADGHGNFVAITATLNTTFGSKVVIPGTGVMMNNQMDDFSIQPGVPNAFGLVGAEANAIAGGKRPLSSMSPTIVMKGGKPYMTLGAAGGPRIITQVVQAIINHRDLGMGLEAAVGAARIHHQWSPDVLYHEAGLDGGIVAKLKAMGYEVKATSFGGVTQAIVREADGSFKAVHDPRVPGKAEAW